MDKAVVLLSGGLDSATTLAIAQNMGFEIYALSFRYGQLHKIELDFAKQFSSIRRVAKHLIVDLNLDEIGGSALTDAKIQVPKHRSIEEMGTDIPITYVPARNMTFLSIATAWAEVLKAFDIFIGVNAVDFSGYPDCRPDFISSMETTANLGTNIGTASKKKISIHTPLIDLTKEQIISEGLRLGVDYALTSTCYDPGSGGRACGECDACLLRAKGFMAHGMTDPAMKRKI